MAAPSMRNNITFSSPKRTHRQEHKNNTTNATKQQNNTLKNVFITAIF